MTPPHPIQQFFSIGEVCTLTDLKPHVLRYWESQFRFLNPAKNRSGNRVYKGREVELIMLVKHLLYTEKFTIEGARQRLEHYKKTGEIRSAAKDAMRYETVCDIRRSLAELSRLLEGGQPMKPAPIVEPIAQQVTVPLVEPARSAAEEPKPLRSTGAQGGEQLSLA